MKATAKDKAFNELIKEFQLIVDKNSYRLDFGSGSNEKKLSEHTIRFDYKYNNEIFEVIVQLK